jgi:hypothetical protein
MSRNITVNIIRHIMLYFYMRHYGTYSALSGLCDSGFNFIGLKVLFSFGSTKDFGGFLIVGS